MATISFEEKVVVTDKVMVAQMRKDLNSSSPVATKRTDFTYDKAQENFSKWLKAQGTK